MEATSIPAWGGGVIVASCGERADARFIAEARDGWPHAIRRALDAEAEVERLRKLVRLMEPCITYDKSSYGNYLWREVMEVITHEQRK
ncbi:hypothetical protein AYJ08_05740 [Brevibacillus sp. SKDU10]|uniref:hypothetical protein n=1 Tax=Brevibacillus sp. SKDU10 TaxID=1247872 RepID=UPI0007C8BFC3|nr:hypothetical protein [Brevibacillus sp. SKDU10]OAJ75119.1 hypothetical protein AYJ08_05740 [Brevibacillus sp. SKDU10]